jgi:hypothetical protein
MNIQTARWDDPALENKPGQWKPTEQPYRVTSIIPRGPRWDMYRSVVRTFTTEQAAREYMATVPSKNRPSLTMAVNAETWRQNG